MLAGRSPARRRLVLGLLVLGVLALLAVAVLAGGIALLGRTSDAVEPASPDRPGPVLLVHGYGGSVASMQPLADRLTAAGRDVTVVALPDGGLGDLADSAGALADAVQAALDGTGAESVDVVGFSMGGLVARLWAADGGAGLVRRVVTLGSPHHGTVLADLAGSVAADRCPEACRQMIPGSPLLTALNAGDETPEGPTWVSIWTAQDEVVTPPESARLEGALNLPVQSVCPDARLDHGDLVANPLVQEMVAAELAPGPPVALRPEDCARLGG